MKKTTGIYTDFAKVKLCIESMTKNKHMKGCIRLVQLFRIMHPKENARECYFELFDLLQQASIRLNYNGLILL